MALLFLSTLDDSDEWLPRLENGVPGLKTRLWPDMGPAEDIHYALVWQPPPGLLASLPNLRAIFCLGAGVDGLIRDSTLPDHVPVVRMVDWGLTEGMTEFVVWQVLDWHRDGPTYRASAATGTWDRRIHVFARERTVGVMGLGVLGSAAAEALAALNFDVAGWSRSPKTIDGVTSFVGADGWAPFLARSEIVVNLLPLTAATTGILNADTFARLPRGAVVINAARGGHVVDSDLLAALEDGQIGGASLDVFAEEPLPPDHPFWRHPRIAVTPHIASVTHARTCADTVIAQIRRLESGAPLRHTVDRSQQY